MTAVERALLRSGLASPRWTASQAVTLALVNVIERAMPRLFDPEAAGGLDARFALEIRGRRPVLER